jgi:hypothetical protein
MTGFMKSRWITFKLCKEILIQKSNATVRRIYCKISGVIFFTVHPVSIKQALKHFKLQILLNNILKLSL